MSYLVDTHCHLNLPEFNQDIGSVIENASERSVRKILVPGIDLETSRTAIELGTIFPNSLYPAVGIHPNYATDITLTDIASIELLASNPSVVAIGEIGLDFYRKKASRDDQTRVFWEMLRISEEKNKPVCVHNRDADDEIIKTLDLWYSGLEDTHSVLAKHPGVFHSYSGSNLIAEWAVAHNFLLGIGGPVTFKKAEVLRHQIEAIDIRFLVLETDAPYLSPHPNRGKRNEPGNLIYIAEEIADIKKISFESVISAASENAARLFNW